MQRRTNEYVSVKTVPLDPNPRKPVTMYRMEPEDCYTIGEVSKKLHFYLESITVYAHIRKYSIPTRQIGNYVYAHKASIDKLYKDPQIRNYAPNIIQTLTPHLVIFMVNFS